ncbi:oligosaccharide flippase family protein [Marseilla massiliensis]|uniref:Oligosaccharide flippase family protein n=1 Tax=Marseilla massiliensis TaxID=1841864 RepID=A0A938WWP6_9BACT|nr:oligosaccharide flippase family protein [Marseilla massiliensis]MBM6674805.1 oligosaccharide flippase family protein [Marseilla massiliensis]
MSQSSEKSERIAKNTLLLYLRMLFLMLVTLYTSRIILNVLGVEDYGIYNVVGGVVAMFSVISGSLSAAISRFITYELGKGDKRRLVKIFSTSVNIQFGLSLIIVLLAETIGLWFLNYKMNIPDERMTAANWVLQFSILTFIVNLISVPYNACIIAHERMSAFAYISILEAISKLGIAFFIKISPIDRLIFYSLLICFVSILIRFTYSWYCKKNFSECHYHMILNKSLLKEMSSFASWNFIGSAAGILRTQGINVVLNLFFTTAVNAARGISVQVNTAVTSFVNNFMTALNPQITKSYACGDFIYMNKLIYQGSRLSFYLLLFLSLPIIIETETILTLWLNIVPKHTIIFVQLILIFAMCEAISGPLITAMLATGDIKKYQIIVGGTNLLNLPISYFLFRFYDFTDFPEIALVVAIILSVICLFQRLWLLKKMINLDYISFLTQVILNVALVALVSFCIPFFVHLLLPNTTLLSVGNIINSFICSAISILYVGCKKKERQFVFTKIKGILSIIKKHGK